MKNQSFTKPVYVVDRLSVVQEVATLGAAVDFLEGWAVLMASSHGSTQETALRACHAAEAGYFPVEGARASFEGFARMFNLVAKPPVTRIAANDAAVEKAAP